MISRRLIQIVLGVLWFVDGIMQLKPPMFTEAFLTQVILPTAQSQPEWISGSITWASHLVAPHIAVWNALFALIQLAIGLGLIFNLRTRTVLSISFIWTFLVWWFGEGFGQVLTGQSLILTGAPGAVLLYGLIGVAIWPASGDTPSEFLGFHPRQLQFARYALGVLWFFGGLLHFQPAYLTSNGFSGAITVDWLSKSLDASSFTANLILGLLELGMGLLLLVNKQLLAVLWVSILLSLVYWWSGQGFGQLFTGLGTDFNAAPLYVLLALCVYPNLLNFRSRGSQLLHS